MEALYTRLHWAAHGGCGHAARPELRPDLDRFCTFFVDYAWAIPDQRGPEARLVRAADVLFRLDAAGAGWGSTEARGFLADALGELRGWVAGLP
jgi:hypothetical protein